MISVIRPALLAPIFSQSAIVVTNFPENDGWRALDEEPQAAGFGGRCRETFPKMGVLGNVGPIFVRWRNRAPRSTGGIAK
jgi:hypothetical protein